MRLDGETPWLIDIGRGVERNPAGDAIRSAGVTIDVTALKAATAAVELRDQAIAAMGTGIAILDATVRETPIVDVNPAFERITGFAKEDVIGHGPDLLEGDDTDPVAKAAIASAIASGREATITLLHYRKDGTPFWNELHLAPVRDSTDKLTHFVGVVNDVSERVRSEAGLRFRGEPLDQATAAVVGTDPAGRITHWSRHATTLYGWTRDEALGRIASDLLVTPSDASLSAEIAARLGAGQSGEGNFTYRNQDGVEVPIHLNASPIFDHDRCLVGRVGVAVDLSERKAFEAQLVHRAFHDDLTGLPNRALFADRMEHALQRSSRRGKSVAVLMLDLGRFKLVNDGLGHTAGNRCLVAVGQRLSTCLRDGDTLARLGGDEFTILVEDATTASARAVRIRMAPDRPRGRARSRRQRSIPSSPGTYQSSTVRSKKMS